jgi:hypothetical protein
MICPICLIRPAIQKHHIFLGNGIRPICDEYKLTIDLCAQCHAFIHRKDSKKRETQKKLMGLIGLDESLFERLNRTIRKSPKLWTDQDEVFMQNIRYFLNDREVKNG